MSSNWQLRRVSDNTIDDDIQSLELTDTFNRFARIAQIELDDPDSVKTSEYPRGTLVELEVAVPGFFDFARRFAGFVADYQQDRNSTTLTILSHDFWIRKRTVNRDFEQTRLDVILQTLIEDLTPLTYNAANVDLQSNPEISREWKGEQLETVLDEIGEISGGNEDYGANNDLEFFYQRREFESSPRNFGQGEYSNVEWSQDGKRDVNRAIIEYGEDDTAGVQIREDAQSQLDLQDKIGSDDPVVIEQRKAYPEITDPDVAADKAKQLLNGKATLLTGEVETWEAFAVTPGMVADVVDPDTGTDGEFVVAEITYRWPSEEPETIVTVADKSVATSEELINLSDDVTRVDLRDTDANAPVEQNIPTRIGALVEPTVLIGGLEAASVRLTNTARNLIRDGWRGVGGLDIAEIAIGDSNANLSRTNTSLENQTNSGVVTESLIGSSGVEYTVSLGDDTTREVGLFDSSGNLLVRATFDEGQFDGSESGSRIIFNIGDSGAELSVLTESGTTAIRDIIADNAPVLPQFYAYGSGGTQPQESDIALETELSRQDLDEIVINSAIQTTDLEDTVGEIGATEPLFISNGEFGNRQIGDTRDALNDNDDEEGSPGFTSGDEYNDGQAIIISGGAAVTFDVTFGYNIPSEDVGIRIRDEVPDGTGVDVSFQWDGVEFNSTVIQEAFLNWSDIAFAAYDGPGYESAIGDPIEAGETHTLRIVNDSSETYIIDCLNVFDEREESDIQFPNPDATENAGGILDGPQEYSHVEKELVTQRTRRDVTIATVSSSWDNVENEQFIEVGIIDDVFDRSANSETASVAVDEIDSDTSIQSRVGFSRHTVDATSIPATGDAGQTLSEWELRANPESITPSGIGQSETKAVFRSGGDLSGQVLREAAQLTSDGTCLSRSIFSPIPESGTLDSTTTIIASEITGITQGVPERINDVGRVDAVAKPINQGEFASVVESASVDAFATPDGIDQANVTESGSITATATPTGIDAATVTEAAKITAIATPSATEQDPQNLAQAQMLASVGQNYTVLESEAGVSAAQAQQLINTLQ